MANVMLSNVIRRAQTKVDKDNTDLIFYVGGEHIVSENIRVHSRGIIAESTIGPMFYYGFKAGDFLLVSRNPHLKKAGLVDFDGICSEKTFVLETADSDVLLPEFLPFVLQNERFWDYAYRHRHGSTNTFINWSTLANYEFELPDLETQRKLAEVLWSINDTMDAYKKLISATDELVKSQFIDMFGAPLSNEKGWPLKRIGDLFSLISRGKQPSYVDHSSVRVVNQACIYWDRFNFENVKYHDSQSGKKTLPVKKDCILINSTGTGTLGRCNVFPELTDGYVYVVDSHVTVLAESHDVNAYFFKCFLQREDVQKKIYAECVNGSTNQIELSKEKLSDVLLVVPPMERQEQFAAFVRQSDKSKFELEQALSELTATYKRIIAENLG